MDFYEAMRARRSRYDISGSSPIPQQRIQEILAEAITLTPSSFHSQSSRAALLFGDRHQKLWSIVLETLRGVVPADKFAATEAKIASFAAGYGTILYFEDMTTVETLQKNFPLYAENFPVWSLQSAGMLQYVVWTALSQEGLGASLQHYNPLIDAAVRAEFGIAENWKLLAQMPFGTPNSEPRALDYQPIEKRLIVQGESHD